MKAKDLLESIEKTPARSAWDKGVKEYAREILAELEERGAEINSRNALNGAEDWNQYSDGGCSLIYDEDIASRLVCPSRRARALRSETNWLKVQARALAQAWHLISAMVHRKAANA